MSHYLIPAAKLGAILLAAMLAGLAVAMGLALVGHEVLVLAYGEDLAPIDDTPPMFIAVASAYLAGIVSGLLVLAIGWRRFVRRPQSRQAEH